MLEEKYMNLFGNVTKIYKHKVWARRSASRATSRPTRRATAATIDNPTGFVFALTVFGPLSGLFSES